MLNWLTAKSPADFSTPPNIIPELAHAREQIVTARLRATALFGSAALIAIIVLNLHHSPLLLVGYAIAVALSWIFALNRQIDYRLRGSVFVIVAYMLALNELLHFGYTPNTIIYLAGFALLPLSFLSWRVGLGALILAVTTLALVGGLLSNGIYQPLNGNTTQLPSTDIISVCLIFILIVGSIQSGNFALRRSLEIGWAREYDARIQLEQAHRHLEQRVAERTAELAELNNAVMAANQSIVAQNQYLSVLQQTTFDLLNHRTLPNLIQEIVDRAAETLNAPYGELMMHDDDSLVVQAFTTNQPFLRGDRVQRGQAQLSWQAFDTKQPVVIDDYSTWAARRSLYNPINLQAVADFPIVVGNNVLGVLALGRSSVEQPFTPTQVQQGQIFSHMIGLILENARLYDRALNEIAERIQAEQSLRIQTEQLRLQNAELDAFAHTVAHDLATPLTGLVGYSELLKVLVLHGDLTELPDYCDIIVQTGHNMARIIKEMLLLASIRNQSDVPNDQIAMEEILNAVELRLAHQIATTQATISLPNTWPCALGHAPWVEEIWANYISNALKYGGQPPQIVLYADQDLPGFVRFWVCDNGPGLSTKQQSQLFTPYTRFHTVRAEGHGLGLSIVQRIAAKLGGEIGVESLPGQGARFFFTLPIEHKSTFQIDN